MANIQSMNDESFALYIKQYSPEKQKRLTEQRKKVQESFGNQETPDIEVGDESEEENA